MIAITKYLPPAVSCGTDFFLSIKAMPEEKLPTVAKPLIQCGWKKTWK